ncbi:50S ribosomal protein L4 [Rickettsiella endosymbiont of Miltochrista miniata]|uniref:50S ribosomal protein L4 n=1 Tax=Rickettsiella endosymbiont of Miltochrista miniata TaxID=3066239 RepID=UPI003CC7AF48
MQVALVTKNGSNQELQLSETVFGCRFNEPLVHQVVTAYLAGGRQGTRAQKNRSAVSGGGKKPWKQKGMGRARAGTIRSPLWRSGGVTFASSTQDFSQKVNKKMYRAAMRSICSELLRQGRFVVLESFDLEKAKTRDFVAKLQELNIDHKVLVVLEEVNENIYLAARNLHKVELTDVEAINPVNLINYEKILITAPALKQIEELLA